MHRKVSCLYLVFLAASMMLPGISHAESVTLTRHGYAIEVEIGGKPFTTYNFDPIISKAFLEPLRDANGVVVTRTLAVGNQIPPGHDKDPFIEPHQRAMYFAHGDIDGYSFWGEEAFKQYYGNSTESAYGRMVFRKLDEIRGGANSGVIRATFDLEGPDKKVFAEETQEYKFSGDNNSRVIDCEFIIKAGKDPVRFGDTKEGTFAIRLAPNLDAPAGNMVSSEGGVGEKQVWGKSANWVNVDGAIDGQKLGVAIFDAPDSFRHPTYWMARGYGLLAANPFGLSFFYGDHQHDGSYTLPAAESIRFRYRVFIHEGTYKDARVADKYAEYAAHP